MTVVCPQCHTENQAGDKFCQECGSPLPEPGASASDPAAGVSRRSAVLVRLGSDGGQEFNLAGDATVGRLDSCDLAIHDSSVSRQHARISRFDGGYRIQDLGSTNGTMVNGTRVSSPQLLNRGDIVTFGSVDFRYEPPEGAHAAVSASPSYEGSPAVGTEPVVDGSIFAGTRPSPVPPPEPLAPEQAPQQEPELIPEPEPVAEAAAAVPPEPAREPAPAASEDDDPVRLAQSLARVVQDLVGRVHAAELLASRSSDRLAELEDAGLVHARVQQALQSAPTGSMSQEQLSEMESMLDSLRASPRDIEVLMTISREAPVLASVVQEYAQMQRVLQEIAQATGASRSE